MVFLINFFLKHYCEKTGILLTFLGILFYGTFIVFRIIESDVPSALICSTLLPEMKLNFEVKQSRYSSFRISSNKMIYMSAQIHSMKIRAKALSGDFGKGNYYLLWIFCVHM